MPVSLRNEMSARLRNKIPGWLRKKMPLWLRNEMPVWLRNEMSVRLRNEMPVRLQKIEKKKRNAPGAEKGPNGSRVKNYIFLCFFFLGLGQSDIETDKA